MLSRAGVQFVDLVVGCECLVGDDEGHFDCGLPPLPVWLVGRSLLYLQKFCNRWRSRSRNSVALHVAVCTVDADARCAMDDGP